MGYVWRIVKGDGEGMGGRAWWVEGTEEEVYTLYLDINNGVDEESEVLVFTRIDMFFFFDDDVNQLT